MGQPELLGKLLQLLLHPGIYGAMREESYYPTPYIGIDGIVILEKEINLQKAASGLATLQLWLTQEGKFKKAILYSQDNWNPQTDVEEIFPEVVEKDLPEIFDWINTRCLEASGKRDLLGNKFQEALFEKFACNLSQIV